MADPHPERLDLDTLAVADSQPETLQCCCGNTDCVYLKHNCSVLDSVEKDVHTAAKLGQVRRLPSLSPLTEPATTSPPVVHVLFLVKHMEGTVMFVGPLNSTGATWQITFTFLLLKRVLSAALPARHDHS